MESRSSARDWPPEEIEICLNALSGCFGERYVRMLAYYHELDLGHLVEALNYMCIAYALTGNFSARDRASRFGFAFEMAFILARQRIAVTKAREIYNALYANRHEEMIVSIALRTRAALEIAEDSPDASQTLNEIEETHP